MAARVGARRFEYILADRIQRRIAARRSGSAERIRAGGGSRRSGGASQHRAAAGCGCLAGGTRIVHRRNDRAVRASCGNGDDERNDCCNAKAKNVHVVVGMRQLNGAEPSVSPGSRARFISGPFRAAPFRARRTLRGLQLPSSPGLVLCGGGNRCAPAVERAGPGRVLGVSQKRRPEG